MRGLLWSSGPHRPNAHDRTDALMPDDLRLLTLLKVLVFTWDTDQLEAFEVAMHEAHVLLGIPEPVKELDASAAIEALAQFTRKAAAKGES